MREWISRGHAGRQLPWLRSRSPDRRLRSSRMASSAIQVNHAVERSDAGAALIVHPPDLVPPPSLVPPFPPPASLPVPQAVPSQPLGQTVLLPGVHAPIPP